VSVDLPLLPASLLVFLVHHAKITGAAVTLCSVNGFPQTFPAVVCRSALPVLQGELKADRRGCFSAFQAAASSLNQPMTILPVEFLVQSGHIAHPHGLPPAWWFLNVNNSEDLRRAADLHASRLA
jgi:molybdopterin-guanine dinucleotide biosynthesis protein A